MAFLKKKKLIILLATVLGVVGLGFFTLHLSQASTKAPPPIIKLAGPGDVVAPFSRTGMVYGVAFSPDSLTLASGDDASNVKLWNSETAELRRVLTGHQGIVHAVAFSGDSKSLVSGSTLYHNSQGYLTGGEVKLWDADSGKLLRSLSWPDYYVNNVALAHDGKTMAISGLRSQKDKGSTDLELRDTQTGKSLHNLPHRPDAMYEITNLIFSPDGKLVATSMRDGIRIWNVTTGQLQSQLPQQGEIFAQPIAFSPDSKLLATSYQDIVEMHDAATGESASKLRIPGPLRGFGLSRIIFLNNTQLIGKATFDFYFWDMQKPSSHRILEGYSLGEAIISPDGKMMAGKNNNDLMLQKVDWSAAKVVPDSSLPAVG